MQIVKYSKSFLLASLVILIPGILSLIFYGLNLGIDFTGGSNFEFKLKSPTQDSSAVLTQARQVFDDKKIGIKNIDITKDNVLDVRTLPVDSAQGEAVKTELNVKLGGVELLMFETVGPSVGAETTQRSFMAVAIAALGILFYIAFAFRNIPAPYSSFRFGVSAIIAMLHDALVVIGIFSILGWLFKIEIDTLFITAILTVIGFSVHDTIVVFDRIRENLKKLPDHWHFDEVVNYSIVETLNRSVSTSLTVVITLTALLLLGGESIKLFSLALLIGIVSGTYSSIFTAAPILVLWEKYKKK